jgi:hypothetical protein
MYFINLVNYIKYNTLNYDIPTNTESDNAIINITLKNAYTEQKIGPDILMDSIREHALKTSYIKYLIEYKLIWVTKLNLNFGLLLFKYIRSIEKQEPGTVEKYISFTRFSRGRDKISCDWCSIINGCMELLLDVIYSNLNDESVEKILDVEELSLNLILFTNKYMYHVKPTEVDLYKYYERIDNQIDSKYREPLKKVISDLLTVRSVIECIETGWCPFKHMTEIDFDRAYYKYNSNDVTELKIASDIIKENGSIKCDSCVTLLNNSNALNKNAYTIFDKYMERVKQILYD